jgi:outer membrane autotransporter protein
MKTSSHRPLRSSVAALVLPFLFVATSEVAHSASGTIFTGTQSAGNAVIVNASSGASVIFQNSSTADHATIINQGNLSNVTFFQNASGGQAAIVNSNSTAFVDISRINGPSITIGSISGIGTIYMGSKNLIIGGNNASTVFSGVFSDGTGRILTEQPSILIRQTGSSLTKVGTGTLTLNGANTYTGNTTVNGGTLIVNGSIVSPSTFVNPGGTLGGSGFIGGSVYNLGGIVSPGNSPGTLTIHRDYNQNSAGTLSIQIASSQSYDKLAVGGSANLDGKLFVQNVNGFVPKRGETFQIITADGGVKGTFSDFQQDTGTVLKYDVAYHSNSVVIEASVGSFVSTLPSGTPNQVSVAQNLDQIANDPRASRLIDLLTTLPLNELPHALDQIAPEELTSVFGLGMAFDAVQSFNIQYRTGNIRAGSSGFSSAGFQTGGITPSYNGGLAGPSGNEGKESKGVMAPIAENKWGVFLTGVGNWVGVSDDANARGYDVDSGGFTLGIDYKVCSHFAVGLMAGYVGTGVDLTEGGRIRINGGKLGAYATAFGDGLYADAAVTGGYSSYTTSRAGFGGTARSDTDGGDLNVLFGLGYDFKAGNFTFGPTASFNYTYTGVSDFTEHGSAAPLHFDSQHQESIRSAFGLKASYDLKCGRVVIKPEVRAAWQHEYGDTNYAIDSSFASGAGDTFTVNGPRIGRDSALIGAGFAVQWNERFTTYVYYDGELGRTNYDSHSVSGGLRLAF